MTEKISPLIEAEELLRIYEAKDVVLVDAGNGSSSRVQFNERHLDGAIFMDLDTQLADIKEDPSIGGRHPLPPIDVFIKTVAKAGISPKNHVVIYDDKNGSNAAARLWWMLRALGHEKVQVLNGGIQAAEKIGFPMNDLLNELPESSELHNVDNWQLTQADISEVEKCSKGRKGLIIDVRDPARFRGEIEPIDLVAGHIPGAINIPFTSNLDQFGRFADPKELFQRYSDILGTVKPENCIVHCGSGVTACHTLLAMDYAGLGIPKLYVGSWSEWSRRNTDV